LKAGGQTAERIRMQLSPAQRGGGELAGLGECRVRWSLQVATDSATTVAAAVAAIGCNCYTRRDRKWQGHRDVVSVSTSPSRDATNVSSLSRLFMSRAPDVIFDQIKQATLIKW